MFTTRYGQYLRLRLTLVFVSILVNDTSLMMLLNHCSLILNGAVYFSGNAVPSSIMGGGSAVLCEMIIVVTLSHTISTVLLPAPSKSFPYHDSSAFCHIDAL